ncbi:MAG TPA: HD domain-containing protein [Labilithrix sp.]
MSDVRAPRGNEWNDVVEALQRLGNMMTIRGHYAEGHPAIQQADDNAAIGFTRLLARIPEIVVALIDGEFVICERPMPELKERLAVLATAMARHEIECVVFQQGMSTGECGALGRALGLAADEPGKVRDIAQSQLQHVLLRFAEIKRHDASRRGVQDAYYLVPDVQEMLFGVANAIAKDEPMERLTVQALANQIVHYTKARTYALHQRSFTRTFEDEATHATNVAFMTAAMSLELGYPEAVCVDVTGGALVHDIGHLLLPDAIRGVPEPLLEEPAKPVFRNHTFLGAQALMMQGSSPLWVAVALEHHRGVDGGGFPKLETPAVPHELVRIVALANYFDRKRTSLGPPAETPDVVLMRASALEEKYFGASLVRSFLRSLGVFPPGTVVELSNRQPAIVTQANGADPWRPQVKFLRGPKAGKRLELKDLNVVEGRHEVSAVSAIAPPLLVLADLVASAEAEMPAEKSPEQVMVEEAAAVLAAAEARGPGKSSGDVAREQLAHMGGLLDDLLELSGDGLLSNPPGGPSVPPVPTSSWPPAPTPSMRAPQPSVKPAAIFSSKPPAMPSQKPPAVSSKPPAARPSGAYSQQSDPPPSATPALRPPGRHPGAIDVSAAAAALAKPPSVSIKPDADFAGPKPARRSAAPAPPTSPPPKTSQSRPVAMPKRPSTGSASPVKTPSLASVPVLVDPNADLVRLGIDHRAAFILTFIDGISTVEDILDASGQSQADVFVLLEALVKRGVISIP